jgi:prepilin-type N-terminal cleavage/methylation domain-containing protein
MRGKWHRLRGVTLIELLIVITLSSLLTVGIMFAMRIGLRAMERTQSRLSDHRRVLGAERGLRQQLAGIIPVAFQCGNPQMTFGTLFFQGEPQAMRFISSYSLEEAGRGYPRILEYLVIPGDNNQGVRLVVNERHYTGLASILGLCAGPGVDASGAARLVPIEPGPGSFVLADKLAFCRLSYYLHDPRIGRPGWSSQFTGKTPPRAIRIEMAPLAPDATRVQMMTMTLPVRAERYSDEPYADVEQ